MKHYYLITTKDTPFGELELNARRTELTESELEYIIEYADEYNYKTPDLESKIRKVLE